MPRIKADRRERLIDFLRRGFPEWKPVTPKQRLKNGLVLRNGVSARSGADLVEPEDEIEILAKPANPANLFPAGMGAPPLDILYADDDLLAVDKPSGLLSVATERERHETAVHLMRLWLAGLDGRRSHDLHAAHRLDRDASGVLLFARSLETKRLLAASWHKFDKTYLAVVDGVPAHAEGVIEQPLWEDKGLFVRVAEGGRGESALTRYRLVRSSGRRSLLEVELGTGRKHQIRVHLAHIGCPIVGDQRYGVSKSRRLALHAARLRLIHPVTGKTVIVSAPVPPLFRRELSLGKE